MVGRLRSELAAKTAELAAAQERLKAHGAFLAERDQLQVGGGPWVVSGIAQPEGEQQRIIRPGGRVGVFVWLRFSGAGRPRGQAALRSCVG